MQTEKAELSHWLVQSPEGEVIYLVDMGRKKWKYLN